MAADSRRRVYNDMESKYVAIQEEDCEVRMTTQERRNSNMSQDLPATPGIRKPSLENTIFDDENFTQSPVQTMNKNRNTVKIDSGIEHELALMKEKSVNKEGPSSTIMMHTTVNTTNYNNQTE